MYVLFGKKRKFVWTLLAVLVAVAVFAGILHGIDAVSVRTATLLIYGWSVTSFGLIAALILWFEPDYVPRLADIQFPEVRRAMFFMASMAVLATLSFGSLSEEEWAFSALLQLFASACGVFALPDWLASVRMYIVARRKRSP